MEACNKTVTGLGAVSFFKRSPHLNGRDPSVSSADY
jgi:hypothetical protein